MNAFEWLKGFWGSWKLLIGLFLASLTLWIIPRDWITDSAVVSVRDQYHGVVGFAALCLLIILGARIFVEAPGFLRRVFLGLGRIQKKTENRKAAKAKVLNRIPKLRPDALDLLRYCLEKDEQVFVVPARNDGPESVLHHRGLTSIVEAEMGDSTHTFRIHDWVWSYLRNHPSAVRRSDNVSKSPA